MFQPKTLFKLSQKTVERQIFRANRQSLILVPLKLKDKCSGCAYYSDYSGEYFLISDIWQREALWKTLVYSLPLPKFVKDKFVINIL